MEPEHVTLYMLEINEGSYLKTNLEKFGWLPGENQVIERYLQASERLRAYGYLHYEVCNFAKSEQYFSVHNRCYWEGNK
jgi:oxygen-independent coproporphyrinogen III oxidase